MFAYGSAAACTATRRAPRTISPLAIAMTASWRAYTAWKCGGAWSRKYIRITIPWKRLIVGTRPPHPTQSTRASHSPNGGRVAAASSRARSVVLMNSPPIFTPTATAPPAPVAALSSR